MGLPCLLLLWRQTGGSSGGSDPLSPCLNPGRATGEDTPTFALSFTNTHLLLGQVGTWLAGGIKPPRWAVKEPPNPAGGSFYRTTSGIAVAEHVPSVPPASSTQREKHARRNVSFDTVFTPPPARPRGEKPKRAAWVRPLPPLGHPRPNSLIPPGRCLASIARETKLPARIVAKSKRLPTAMSVVRDRGEDAGTYPCWRQSLGRPIGI